MAESYKIFPLRALPGIKKDGTQTEGSYWNDGVWTRFYRGLPRSILGYRSMTEAYPGPSRGLFVNLNGTGYLDIFSGSANNLTVGQFTTGGFGSGVTDITPAGFAGNSANVWQLDSFYNANGGGEISLIAHAAPNLVNISSNIAEPIYYGDITAVVPLVAAQDDLGNTFKVSGGILALDPYVIAYGSLGLVAWSAINDPSTFPVANQANPTSTKIVKGMSIRGNSAPACLLWSLDSILEMAFVGGDVVWSFTTLTDQSSILSSSGVVEMDGIYYWPGIDRWLTYNGVLRELPNEMNLDFFYSNLNAAHRQKVFGFKIPKWGEIWWCFPMGTSTECNHAIIYNVRENSWYDTPLPSDGRSAAYFAQSWQYPVMGGAQPFPDGSYQMWQSEYGNDEIQGSTVNAIQSYVTSPPISIVSGGLTVVGPIASQPRWTQCVGFEPDFLYGSSLNINILTREFAQDADVLDQQNIITQSTPNYFDTQVQARYVRYQIMSNVQGGYYIMGQPMVLYRDGDANP
jgi:hypothetical protein